MILPARILAPTLLLLVAGCASFPLTGEGVSGVDRSLRAFMQRWNVPGLALAVAMDGRLVLARGYGHADPATGEPVQPDSLFRIASASKPVTAIAVMTLVESGRIALDEPVFGSLLPEFPQRCGNGVDPRIYEITARHLLINASGWDTSSDVDPMFNAARIASRRDEPGLARAEAVIQHMVCQGLEFQPGTDHVYENVNYAVLGRVVEAVSESSYESYVRDHVWGPVGVTAPRIGRSLRSGRFAGEARYVAQGNDRRRVPAAVGDGRVPLQYGGFDLKAMDSHGGWVASAPDLVRLMAGVDGHPGVADILEPATVERMGANPGPPVQDAGARVWYALGWYRNRAGDWFHDGSLPGSAAFMGMTPDGVLFAALANTRHPNPEFTTDFHQTVRGAAEGASIGPARDLFPAFGYPAGNGR
jgi:N-acyl-D-amino-acid deacylase